MEYPGKPKVGEEPLTLKNKVIELEGIVNNHRQTEKSLWKEVKYLPEIIENIQETVVIANKDMVIEYMSPSCMSITGHSLETQKGKTIFDLVHPEDINHVVEAAKDDVLTKTGRKIEYRYKHSDGHYVWFETSGSLLYNDEGEIKGAIFIGRDITERKRMEEALRESEEMYRTIFENTGTATIIVDDQENTILLANAEFEKLTGYNKEEVEGKKSWTEFVAEEDLERVKAHDLVRRINPEMPTPNNYELKIIDKSGNVRDINMTVSSIPRTGKKVASLLDITERKKGEEQLKYLSLRDLLTGLYNRNYFEEESNRLQAGREYPLGLILCDVDGLKLVNDALGHKEGDDLLKAAANVLKKCFRASDIVARVGGDEFAWLMPNSSKNVLEESCRRIRDTVEDYNSVYQVPLSLSLGFALADGKTLSIDNLYKEADKKMYREKMQRSIGARTVILDSLIAVLIAKGIIDEEQIQRQENIATSLAEALGMSERNIGEIHLLARFRDIGLVGVPESILNKKMEILSQKEQMEIQRHCEIGHRIALSAPDLAPIADWILKHHEWWNGKGYPLKLKGEEIPIECRILSVVEAYDAMINDYPYRKAMSQKEAFAELNRCQGRQFDPYLVDQFAKIMK